MWAFGGHLLFYFVFGELVCDIQDAAQRPELQVAKGGWLKEGSSWVEVGISEYPPWAHFWGLRSTGLELG